MDKNLDAFISGVGICYESEHGEQFTREDFMKIAEGDETKARNIFDIVSWEHPATVALDYDELFEEEEEETPPPVIPRIMVIVKGGNVTDIICNVDAYTFLVDYDNAEEGDSLLTAGQVQVVPVLSQTPGIDQELVDSLKKYE